MAVKNNALGEDKRFIEDYLSIEAPRHFLAK